MEGTEVTPTLILRALLEGLFLLAVVWVLLRYTDLRKRLIPLGAAALGALFVFFAASGVVQMVDRWQYNYPQSVAFIPLTRFAMYQAQIPSSVEATYSWQGTRADGSQVELNPAAAFSSVGLPPLSTRMRVLLGSMYEGSGGPDYASASHELTLYAQGLDAAERADGNDFTRLAFYRVTGTPGDVEAQELISWDTGELRSR